MKPQITRRTALNRIATAMLVASALNATATHAASFQYRHPVVGLVSSPTAQVQQVVTEILMALTGGPELPAGEVNSPYSYDLNQLLSVTGDSAYSASGVTWSLSSGELPAGLSLGSSGVIAGIPTTKNTVGDSFQVLATYKTKTGQQAFTIVVNGAVLHVTQVASGWYHTCAVTTAGGVKCWGRNNSGQLGDGSTTNRISPVDVTNLSSGVASISAGGYHSCAVTSAGGVKCWGSNSSGQLGDNSITQRNIPTNTAGLASGVVSVAAGSTHTCAVTVAGGARCWGFNYYGQLGNGSNVNQLVPVDVFGLTSGVAQLSSGGNHTCAITTAGGALCWGYNGLGQLGDNSLINRKQPVAVSSMASGVVQLSAGDAHSCAVTQLGEAKCWGSNTNGQLGDASIADRKVPTAVSGLSAGVAHISAGYYHTCATSQAGEAKCWGANSQSQLGDNSTTQRTVPTTVFGLTSGVTYLTGGASHTCAVTAAGAKCWGSNTYGQLGDSTTTARSTPVTVAP